MPESTIIDAAEPELPPADAGIAAPPPEAARAALARVLMSEELSSSPQLSNILRFVVEATLEGRREAIKGYTIAVEALGRDASFDPQADPIVRVEATRLRRALERYYAGAGAQDEIEIVVPRGSYVPQFVPRRAGSREGGARDGAEAGERPAALPATEPAELSEPGEAGPSPAAAPLPAAATMPPPRGVARRWAGLTLAVLVVASAVALFGYVYPGGLRSAVSDVAFQPIERFNRLGIPMIEVRAFDETGAVPTSLALADAGTVAPSPADFPARAIEVRVRDALARFDLLDVLSSPDARPSLGCASTANAPHSAFALGGLVEHHEDRAISVLLRLTDLCDGTIVWSREFDGLRPGTDSSAAEVALVREIMAAIAEPYGVIQARARSRVVAAGGAANAGPYGCVLEAYSYWRSYVPAEHERARACLEKAVESDGTFALGYALLAELYLDEVRNGVNPRPGPPALNRALAAAEQAVELAPTSAYVRRVLMDVHFFRGERGPALAAGDAALALNPYDVDVLADVGGRLVALGQPERGEALLASATLTAPGMPPWVDVHRVVAAYARGDIPAAAAAADHLMGDGFAPGLLARALASASAGEKAAAHADVQKLIEIAPEWASEPDVMVSRFFPDPALAQRVRADLAAAGLPGLKATAAAN
ncbi:tetratricopeptide repeat protein [Ancylobacter sp. G4_0304]|uniref:tetratricopeptide repeat protein n=1 Tax=Ancylobacter sp. G4_0304 TaxID=3114289 RepID=UPI0039C62455